MASTTTTGFALSGTTHRGWSRALTVGGAVIAAAAIWVLAVPVLGLHLIIRFGNGSAQNIAIGYVLGATLIASLAGWGLLVVLERRIPRGRTIWTFVAVAVLLVSLSLPFIAGTSASSKAILAAMHIVVAAILIVGLRGGVRVRT